VPVLRQADEDDGIRCCEIPQREKEDVSQNAAKARKWAQLIVKTQAGELRNPSGIQWEIGLQIFWKCSEAMTATKSTTAL
jgi:hypothetical protein